MQLLEEIAIQQYEVDALAHKGKVQPKTSESYRIIIKASAENHKQFHSYKLKEGKKLQNSVNKYALLKSTLKKLKQIEKLAHTDTNIWNIKHYRTKLSLSMFFVEMKPAPKQGHIQCRIYTTVLKKIRNRPNTKGILLNVQTVTDMGTPKIIAISNQDE
jgi:hypothetical protein